MSTCCLARVQVLAQLLERPHVAALAANLTWDLSPGAGQHMLQQTLWALQVTLLVGQCGRS